MPRIGQNLNYSSIKPFKLSGAINYTEAFGFVNKLLHLLKLRFPLDGGGDVF
jgi:hypothetical protein